MANSNDTAAASVARFIVVESVPRSRADELRLAVVAEFGEPVTSDVKVLHLRFGDPRSNWEQGARPAHRLRHAAAQPPALWQKVVNAYPEAGTNAPRLQADAIRSLSAFVLDDPLYPELVVVLHAEFAFQEVQSRHSLYGSKWSLQHWLRKLTHPADDPNQAPYALSVSELRLALPDEYPQALAAAEQALDLLSNAKANRDAIRQAAETMRRILPFGIDNLNERFSHFLGETNSHTMIGDWGFMTGPGMRSVLIQQFGETGDLRSIAPRNKPGDDPFLDTVLEMPGDLSGFHWDIERWILPLLVERWAFTWFGELATLEREIGIMLDLLRDAAGDDTLEVVRGHALPAVRKSALSRFSREAVERQVAAGVERMGNRKGFRKELPGLLPFHDVSEPPWTMTFQGSLRESMQEASRTQETVDRDLDRIATTLGAVLQVDLAARQQDTNLAVKRLTWVAILLALVTLFSTLKLH